MGDDTLPQNQATQQQHTQTETKHYCTSGTLCSLPDLATQHTSQRMPIYWMIPTGVPDYQAAPTQLLTGLLSYAELHLEHAAQWISQRTTDTPLGTERSFDSAQTLLTLLCCYCADTTMTFGMVQ